MADKSNKTMLTPNKSTDGSNGKSENKIVACPFDAYPIIPEYDNPPIRGAEGGDFYEDQERRRRNEGNGQRTVQTEHETHDLTGQSIDRQQRGQSYTPSNVTEDPRPSTSQTEPGNRHHLPQITDTGSGGTSQHSIGGDFYEYQEGRCRNECNGPRSMQTEHETRLLTGHNIDRGKRDHIYTHRNVTDYPRPSTSQTEVGNTHHLPQTTGIQNGGTTQLSGGSRRSPRHKRQRSSNSNDDSMNFQTLEARIDTYDNRQQQPESLGQKKPRQLAKAGFYYTQDHMDTCYACSVGLKSWKLQDNVFSEHEQTSKKCPYVQQHEFKKYKMNHEARKHLMEMGYSKHKINRAKKRFWARSGAQGGQLPSYSHVVDQFLDFIE